MTIYQVAFKKTSEVSAEVQIQYAGATLPVGTGWTHPGDINHDGDEFPGADALWHHIRDVLYKVGFTDMSKVTIRWDVLGVTAGPDLTVKVGSTIQIQAATIPADAKNPALTYSSATPANATINASGLITGVQVGTSVITVTSADDNTKTDTMTVTVIAAS